MRGENAGTNRSNLLYSCMHGLWLTMDLHSGKGCENITGGGWRKKRSQNNAHAPPIFSRRCPEWSDITAPADHAPPVVVYRSYDRRSSAGETVRAGVTRSHRRAKRVRQQQQKRQRHASVTVYHSAICWQQESGEVWVTERRIPLDFCCT